MITQIDIENQNRQIIITKTLNEIEKARQNNTMSDLKQANNIMPYYTYELSSRLSLYIAESLSGKAKVKPVSVKYLLLLPVEIISHYTIKNIINFIGNNKVSSTAMYQKIASNLSLEFDLSKVKQVNSEKFDILCEYINKSGYNGQRKNKITRDLLTKYYSDIINHDLTKAFMQVAQLAVHLLAECQPMVNGEIAPLLIHLSTIKDEEKSGFGLTKSKTMIIPSDWLLDWLREQTSEGNMIPNYYTALIEKPKPWVSLTSGGFHTEHMRLPLIKTTVEDTRFNFNEMRNTVNAINILQETSWEINHEVLEVMQYALKNRLNWGDLAIPQEVLSMPYPFPNMKRSDMSDEQLEHVKLWANNKALLHSEYASDTSKYMAINRIVNEAVRFKDYKNLYFVYQTDFRGRIYPAASNLHPQGSQHVKALLRFSEGKPILDKQAETYLAVQGANTYGNDKIRMEEKLAWVKNNETNIIQAANNPIDSTFWKQADEPWLFLAFCFEWKSYKQNGRNHLSKLPIALDGSCNGLQHLSAMLRDEVGGREVNLTNNYKKEDIYNAVRKLTLIKLAEDDSELARKIGEFGVERSTCKRPVMIIPYAGTQNACNNYIAADFEERGGRTFFGNDFDKATRLTTKLVWASIGEVIIKGREVMQWFKKAAREAIKKSEHGDIEWTTPNGFRVIQRRMKFQDELLQTSLGDKVRLSMRLKTKTNEVDISGHTTAISPNFIHSLDACALQNTVLECFKQGITSFAMIHDSYGVHAAESGRLAKILREEFVKMYSGDVLRAWIGEQPIAAQELFPELPSKGKLDLNEVLLSEHFFA